jgi:hypothetical protein
MERVQNHQKPRHDHRIGLPGGLPLCNRRLDPRQPPECCRTRVCRSQGPRLPFRLTTLLSREWIFCSARVSLTILMRIQFASKVISISAGYSVIFPIPLR